MDTKNKYDVEKFRHLGKYMNYTLGMPNFKEINGIVYKLCTKCKKYKPMTEEYFSHRSNVKCGFSSACKECDHEKEQKRTYIKPFNDCGELYCQTCKTYKPTSEFNTGTNIKKRNGYSRECKECESNRKKIARASMNINDKEKFLKHLLHGCKTRALSAGLQYDLDIDFIIKLYDSQDGKCALSGIQMKTVRQSGKNIFNASIDRIIPGSGYTKDNVRLVCNHINMMRSNLEDEQLIQFCKAIIEYDKLNKHKTSYTINEKGE